MIQSVYRRSTITFFAKTIKAQHCCNGIRQQKRDFRHNAHPRFLSTTGNRNDNDDNNKDTNEIPSSTTILPSDIDVPTMTIFPWRHDATTPLPRIQTKDDLSGLSINARSRFVKKVSSALEMKVGILDMLLFKEWEREIANNCSWAFQMAMSALLSKTFDVSLSKIENTQELGILFDNLKYVNHKEETDDVDDDNITTSNEENEADNNDTKSALDTQKEDDDDNREECISIDSILQRMMDENLLSLYQQPTINNDDDDDDNVNRNNTPPFQIIFCLLPIASRLENIFLVPSLTREDVKQTPSLKGAYSAIEKAWYDQGRTAQNLEKIQSMAKELMQKTVHSGSKRSIIMDVSIDCHEMFQIKDTRTGKVIQGQGKSEGQEDDDDVDVDVDIGENDDTGLQPKETTHLVRFEMVTSKGENPGERELGSWYIIDIDDQLNGNTWH